MGTEIVFYTTTPSTSLITDDEDQSKLTPITGNPEQCTSQIPQRQNHPIQLCEHLQPVPDRPKSLPLEDQGQGDSFRP